MVEVKILESLDFCVPIDRDHRDRFRRIPDDRLQHVDVHPKKEGWMTSKNGSIDLVAAEIFCRSLSPQVSQELHDA
jgi:hypothetical protein